MWPIVACVHADWKALSRLSHSLPGTDSAPMDRAPAVHLQRKVSEDRYYRAFAKKAVSLSGTTVPVDQEYARFIGPDTPWLREVPSQILRNGAVRWKQAVGRFFLWAGQKTRLPEKKRTAVGLDHLRTLPLSEQRPNAIRRTDSRNKEIPARGSVLQGPYPVLPSRLSPGLGRSGTMVRLLLLGRWSSGTEGRRHDRLAPDVFGRGA